MPVFFIWQDHGLMGKIKTIKKPKPIRNQIKSLADAVSQIVLNLELYEGKEKMQITQKLTALQLVLMQYSLSNRIMVLGEALWQTTGLGL